MIALSTQPTVACWICTGPTHPAPVPIPGLLDCDTCGFRFRPPEDLDVGAHHDDDYFNRYAGGGYLAQDRERRHEARMRLRWLAENGVCPPGRLLEVGSAAGQFLAEAARVGWEAQGVEANAAMADYARGELGVDVSTGLVQHLESEPQTRDVVVMWHVLEHIPEPRGVLEPMVAMLRPGGRLCVEVPNLASREATVAGANWVHLNDPNHVSHYTPDTIGKLMRAVGLEVTKVDTVAWRHYAPSRRTRITWSLASLRQDRAWRRTPHTQAQPLLRVCARRPSEVAS